MEVRAYYRGYHPALDRAIRFHVDRLGVVEISSGYRLGLRDFDLLVDPERFQALRVVLESFGLKWEVLDSGQTETSTSGGEISELETLSGD